MLVEARSMLSCCLIIFPSVFSYQFALPLDMFDALSSYCWTVPAYYIHKYILCVCVLLLVQSSPIAFLPQGCCQHERVVDAGTELRSSKRKNIKRVSDGKGGAILASNKRLHETR